jgi:hypothetical protein
LILGLIDGENDALDDMIHYALVVLAGEKLAR